MCEYCEQYGDKTIWYLNPRNYGRQLYRRKERGKKYVPDAISYRARREEIADRFNRARLMRDKEKMDQLREEIDKIQKATEENFY